MDQLFVEIEICTKNDKTEIFTTVQSFMALYVYRFLSSPANIKLRFVNNTKLPAHVGKLKLRSEKLKKELTDTDIVCTQGTHIQAIRDLKLPVYAKDENTYIAGMCAVCRALVQRQPCLERRKLLGFKDSCLLAPSETSVWTKFCELDIIEAITQLLQFETVSEMPVEVTRFEQHMNEPVRVHNIYKIAREQVNNQTQQILGEDGLVQKSAKKKHKILINCSTPKEQLPIEHRFAEGIVFTIADLILYPCLRLIFQKCSVMLQYFPLTSTWLSEIDAFDASCNRVFNELYVEALPQQQPNVLKILDCEATSLYKSDPKRYKPKNRIYTAQNEVEASMNKLQKLQLEFSSDSSIAYDKSVIDWSAIEPEHEKNSALPKKRLERKRQQLENVTNAVISLATPGERIIDFCSGTGHLGILLALKLPRCTVIFMENKALSLERAKSRALELNLRNCIFYQCNIDYFVGTFDLGTSLHACGTASDIVLRQCLRSRAKFVCCPCCYGALQPMPHISYPLSKRFRSVLSEKDYLYIAHTADQSHDLDITDCKPELSRQGQLCMDIVDTDRKLQLEESGYDVILTRLKPEKCTPKNRLLIGRPLAPAS